ncbi:MAG: SH3 domain-containing protein [Bryobacteraceae bacterium]
MPGRFQFASAAGAILLVVLAMAQTACNSKEPPEQAIGMAYVAPMQLNLRKDLAPKAPVAAVLKHGDKLDVLATRRRFIKVRTAQGAEGWADAGQLLSPAQMEGLHRLAEQCKNLPSQGVATVYDDLNIHTEPARLAPSFDKIVENMKVEVIGYRAAPRTAARNVAVFAKPVALKAIPKKVKESKKIPPPPMPAPPKLPADWLEISQVDEEELAERTAEKEAQKQDGPVAMDEWNLVRTKDGKAGWVLARMLVMSIPDEVAQYAEGRRIAAYLPVGEVKEHGVAHANYVWATVSKGQRDFQFDSFRVFVWSTRHHRYETAYIERNVKGYYPLDASTSGDSPSFSVVVEDKDGSLVRKTYAFSGFHVRLIKKEPYQLVKVETQLASALPAPSNAEETRHADGWTDRIRNWRLRVFGR